MIDLPSLLAEAGASEPIVPNGFEPTRAQERELERLAAAAVLAWNVELRGTVIPAYREAIRPAVPRSIGLQEVEQALDTASRNTARKVTEAEADLERFFRQFGTWHTERTAVTIGEAANTNIRPLLRASEIEDAIRLATRRNVALIRGLDDEMRKRVERAVLDSFGNGSSVTELRRVLRKDLKFAPSRAKLIARDQLSKIAGEFDRVRHAELNIKRFVWQHSLLPNPREHHLDRHRKVFRWDRPPNGEIPGGPINCRCRSIPYLEPSS